MVHAAVDIRPRLNRKLAAITAHTSEAARERSFPGLLARLPKPEREAIVATEFFTRLDGGHSPGPSRLNVLTV